VIAQELLELLACPKCHQGLAAHPTSAPAPRGDEGPEGFVCKRCKLFYALDDGLPNMLIEEARAWPLEGRDEKSGA
jgi:uncharacterized protein YbaR (Trm112 family)